MRAKITHFIRESTGWVTDDTQLLSEALLGEREPSTDIECEEAALCPVYSINVVGFDHKLGGVLEFKYPLDAESNDVLINLSLPEGVHRESSAFLYFIAYVGGGLKFCVSCYRQVRVASGLLGSERNFIQKAVTVVSNLPFCGALSSRLQPVTQAYFEQGDFSSTEILVEAYRSFNRGLEKCQYSELYLGFSVKCMLKYFREEVLSIFKLMLLECRVLVYSDSASKASSFVFALLSLLPGQLMFHSQHKSFANCKKALAVYGLPLKLFTEEHPVYPFISLSEMSSMENSGYLLGCTNRLLTEQPPQPPHALVNLDTLKVTYSLSTAVSRALKRSPHEGALLKRILNVTFTQKITLNWEYSEEWVAAESSCWPGSDDYIRKKFHIHLKTLLSGLAYTRTELSANKDLEHFDCSKALLETNREFLYQWAGTKNFAK